MTLPTPGTYYAVDMSSIFEYPPYIWSFEVRPYEPYGQAKAAIRNCEQQKDWVVWGTLEEVKAAVAKKLDIERSSLLEQVNTIGEAITQIFKLTPDGIRTLEEEQAVRCWD